MYFGCRTPLAAAELSGERISVQVGTREGDPDRCMSATVGWHGYELKIRGLTPGNYDVLVREEGKSFQYSGRVRIASVAG
jgi:hypothetical protein